MNYTKSSTNLTNKNNSANPADDIVFSHNKLYQGSHPCITVDFVVPYGAFGGIESVLNDVALYLDKINVHVRIIQLSKSTTNWVNPQIEFYMISTDHPLSDVTAFDAEDGDITNKINIVSNNVNTSKVGNYEVVYEVTDSKGVSTTKVISVVVVSNNKPVIIGANDIKIKKGSKFDLMAGVSAYDYEDGDLTNKITVLGTVDTNKPGRYGIVYSVSDSEDNITKITRKVTVYDNKSNLMQNPQTGEQSNTMLWVATGAVALMGLALLNRRKK